MLELRDIHYQPATAEIPILNGIDLKAKIGKPVIIFGESGSGKTSLVEVISGLSKQHKGIVSWADSPLNPRQRRWLSGIVFQFPERHFLGLTVNQELKLGHKRLGNDEKLNALEKVGLESLDLQTPPEKLSGGQQRRLALATQLLKRPLLLLLDEPTAGLDWSVRSEIIDLLKEISKDILLIIMSHEPELFNDWLTYSYKLYDGKLIETGVV
tara:strand:- start:97 stop:732 length:636 start_codon:yes stop_codon:yes gene_type:complete